MPVLFLHKINIFFTLSTHLTEEPHFDITKTKLELGYEPRYSYIEAMEDFYHEMQTEPFALLWGKKEDYI